jgi:hypothetical protein
VLGVADMHDGGVENARRVGDVLASGLAHALLRHRAMSCVRHALACALALSLMLGLAGDAAAKRRKAPIRMPKPGRGAQIVVGPIPVPKGSEVTECTYMKLPSKKDLAVNKVKIKVHGGSHHIHLYRPHDRNLSLENAHEACNFALDFDVWQLILGSQSVLLNWKLPDGIAFHFTAGEQLAAQTHFVDNGALATPEDGWAIYNLYAVPERKVTSYAGALFGQDKDVVVPAHSVATATTRCLFDRPVDLLALTGHYHYRGVQFTANVWDGEKTGAPLYAYYGYDEPTFRRFAAGEQAQIPGIEWTCTYENDTDTDFTFGPFTDENEHCNLFAFYYPTFSKEEFMSCVQQDGQVTVTVRH